jgi:uncharacterized membrane protein
MKLYLGIFIILSLFFNISCKKTDDVTESTNSGVYFTQVKKIIQNNCLSCHNQKDPTNWSGRPVALDTDEDIVIRAAFIKESVVNKRMPRGGSLSDSDIDIIVQWYKKGGKASD